MGCLYFFFTCSGDPRDLHSFPTRRSSDLGSSSSRGCRTRWLPALCGGLRLRTSPCHCRRSSASTSTGPQSRSEEHTSELQSRENLVCRLLLEKKKKTKKKFEPSSRCHSRR